MSTTSSEPIAAGTTRVPRVVPTLALSIFALGTSEFMIAGLLPEMAADLGVGIPQIGYLISAFAVGMIVGAPAMAVLTLRLPRRTTLVAMLLVVIGAHAVGALAQTYPVLLAARVVTAVATGGFWAVAAVVTVSSVAPSVRARALSWLLAGLTVANVVGIPLGTVVGQAFGWRTVFWLVGGLAGIGLLGVLAVVPGRNPSASTPLLSAELEAFRRGRLWLALGTTALYQGAAMAAAAYLAPLLIDVAGLAPGWVPVVQFGFGLGGLAGIVIGGRIADARPWSTLFTALVSAAVLLAVLGVAAGNPVVAVTVLVVLGLIAFVAAAPLNARVFALAGSAPTLASSTNTSAFNVGNALGPALGGLAIGAGWGLTSPLLIGVVLMTGSIGLALASVRTDRRRGEPGS